jgi:hypothetical protein
VVLATRSPGGPSSIKSVTMCVCGCSGSYQNGNSSLEQITDCQGSTKLSSQSTGPACSGPRHIVPSHQTTEAFSYYRKWDGPARALVGDWMVSDAAARFPQQCFVHIVPVIQFHVDVFNLAHDTITSCSTCLDPIHRPQHITVIVVP